MNNASPPDQTTDLLTQKAETQPFNTAGGPGPGADRPEDGSKPTVDVSKLPRIRRRTYVIDKRRQYRTALLTSGLAALLLIIVNTAFTLLRTSQTMAISSAAPMLGSTLSQQDTRVGLMLIAASIVFVIGVFVITIAETHRTAGAVYAMYGALERVADGDYRTPLRLRPQDNLRDLRAPFNEMISTLRKQALADAEALTKLAKSAAENPHLAKQLNALADQKRKAAEADTTA